MPDPAMQSCPATGNRGSLVLDHLHLVCLRDIAHWFHEWRLFDFNEADVLDYQLLVNPRVHDGRLLMDDVHLANVPADATSTALLLIDWRDCPYRSYVQGWAQHDPTVGPFTYRVGEGGLLALTPDMYPASV